MAENDQERTEQPTHRKKAKARQKGNVPKSQELRSAIMILGGALTLKWMGPYLNERLISMFIDSFSRIAGSDVTVSTVPPLARGWIEWCGAFLSPMFIVLSLMAIASSGLTQGGFILSTQALAFNPGRLNPVSGAKNIFSGKMAFNLFRDMLKIAVISFVCYGVIRDTIALFLSHADIAISELLSGAGGLVISLLMRAGLVLLVLGFIDLAYQKRKYINDLKMSRREIKDEAKESDGDPLVKGRQRAEAKSLARKRMMAAVPDADVVLTNPTEFAVALKYDPESMAAPVVVAKGRRLIAKRIKEIALEAGVPVIENRYLARTLYRLAEIGGEVPMELYRAVAEVMSFVFRRKGKIPPIRRAAKSG